jgi:molecular chaperone DnaK
MTRQKIDYGIDLGTTNSAIARMDNGEIMIKKSDEATQTDTTPSCVYINKKQVFFVGQKASNQLSDEAKKAFVDFQSNLKSEGKNTFIEFKRDMGTTIQYESSNAKRSFSPEEFSSEVLKKLRSFVTDEEVNSVVITVPAMFKQHQIDATQKAAELAGFKYCELLQEPIAASIAYGLSAKNTEGYWLVFDFGGGTFDAALMKLSGGIMKVETTGGNNHLGGKDIDEAIVDHILIPALSKEFKIDKILSGNGRQLLREALKGFAEKLKIELSTKKIASSDGIEYIVDDDDQEIVFYPEVSLEEFEKIAEPIYQKAIDITKKVIESKNVTAAELNPVILVGGPTKSQTLQRMLKEQLGSKIDGSIDPMTVVARGAAFFASTRNNPIKGEVASDKIQVSLKYPESSPETEIKFGIKINRKSFSGQLPDKIYCQVDRTDKGWSSGKFEVVDDAEIVDILLEEKKVNRFNVTLFDEHGNILKCEPSYFQILPIQIAQPTLTYDICIEAFHFGKGKQLLIPLNGLKKDTTLPAKGSNKFRTLFDIRPDESNDKIDIVVYQGPPLTRAIFGGDFVWRHTITGNDIPGFLPKDSELEIKIDIDTSRRVAMSIDIPYLNDTIEVKSEDIKQNAVDETTLSEQFKDADSFLKELENEFASIDSEQAEEKIKQLQELFENGKGNPTTRTQVMEELRKVMIELEAEQTKNEFPKIETELEEALEYVNTVNTRYGDNRTSSALLQLEEQTKVIIKNKNTKSAKDLISQLYSLAFAINFQQLGYLIGSVKYWDDNFNTTNWTNKSKATQLMTEAKQNIVSNPSKAKLQQIVGELFLLLPDGTPPPRELEGGLGY